MTYENLIEIFAAGLISGLIISVIPFLAGLLINLFFKICNKGG